MRIIAGTAKGRRLQAPAARTTRPMTDRVREALFSSLGRKVVGARVLDLFAGSGAVGLEALSRGAAAAVFVENARGAVITLRENLAAVGLGGVVVAQAVERFTASPSGPYDVVFVDAPWAVATGELETLLGRLEAMVAAGGTVVVSRRSGDAVPSAPPGLRHSTDRRYGDTRIIRYEKETV